MNCQRRDYNIFNKEIAISIFFLNKKIPCLGADRIFCEKGYYARDIESREGKSSDS
jgi:hypothetical protein